MYTIGVDVGGTKIAAGVIDDNGAILARTRLLTDPEDSDQIIHSINAAISELRRDIQVAAVGVAVPGMVAPSRDVVNFAPNLPWRSFPLRERLEALVDVPVMIENDANAAAWGEFQFGVGRNVNSMVMFTLGTGVGGGVILDGRLLRGAFGAAGELGHMKVVPHGHFCGCGHEGCLERYASGQALTLAARHRAITDPEGIRHIQAIAGEGRKIKGPHVTAAAVDGDPLAQEILAELGMWTGLAAASIGSILDPELFVIGGGVAESGDLFIESIRQGYLDHLFSRGYRPEAQIELAELGNDAGMVGAGDLARR